jgi:hypothetical protein
VPRLIGAMRRAARNMKRVVPSAASIALAIKDVKSLTGKNALLLRWLIQILSLVTRGRISRVDGWDDLQ